MDIKEIKTRIDYYKKNNFKIFATSSFQTQSVVLLHIISIIDKKIPIYFINTGYHFPETLEYKEKLKSLLDLNVIEINPIIPKIYQKDKNSRLLCYSDVDFCCHLNKVKPLETLLYNYDVWISGIRKDQTENRKMLNEEELTINNVIRFHPLLNWTTKMIYEYIKENKLPKHPLEDKGYFSIGCEPCTRPVLSINNKRSGRWKGLNKTECGLHTTLVLK